MSAPVILAALALALASGGAALLRDARWASRSPRAGLWAWQVLSVSVATALVLAVASVAMPLLPIRSDVARLMGITTPEVVEHYLTPVGQWLAVAGLVAAAVLLGRFLWVLGASLWVDRRDRTRHADSLVVVGRRHPNGFLVVDHADAAVYCLPGRRAEVVVTEGALRVLSARQLILVLGHERAHLRARHDLPLVLAEAMRRTFRLRVFALALEQIATLAEMQADDSARQPGDRRDLARALLALAENRRPTGSLAAGTVAAPARVQRLVRSGDTGMTRLSLATMILATLSILILPWLIALAPAAEASLRECCPVAVPVVSAQPPS